VSAFEQAFFLSLTKSEIFYMVACDFEFASLILPHLSFVI